MIKNCLYCYQPLIQTDSPDFHEKCSVAFFGTKTPPVLPYTFDQMADLAKSVVERSISVPGVQPKLSLTSIKDNLKEGAQNRLTIVGELGGNYILKPPSEYYPEMPANEHLTMRIAESFGIRTVPSTLIRLQSGELAYLTKRIDRTEQGEKIHMLDMFQILEANDKYKSSMEKIGKALDAYSANTQLDKLYYFEIVLFSFLTGNNDMHLKNFSMILAGNEWTLSPAYDLLNATIANPDDTEELALTIDGKKSKFKLSHFTTLAEGLKLTSRQISGTFSRFEKNKALAFNWIDNSFLTNEYRVKYKEILTERYDRIITNGI